MQREVLVEPVEAEKALQRGCLHAAGIHKAHVVFNKCENLTRVFIRETEPPQNLRADGDADLDMTVKADAVWRAAVGRWLADVVEQRAPCQRCRAARLKLGKQAECMHPHVALGMVLRRLFDAFHARDFRQYLGQQGGFVE